VVCDEVIPKLPDLFDPEKGCEFPKQLIGATIERFGTSRQRIEGGLVIEYKTKSGRARYRLELAFTDRGMWVHRNKRLPIQDDAKEFHRGGRS
jgi:hypothetical protein